MSRSYKHTPIVKDHDSGKFGKKAANRRVRQSKGAIPNGKAYRKLYETYDIHDQVSRYSWTAFIRNKESEAKHVLNGGRKRHYGTDEHGWAKYYKRK